MNKIIACNKLFCSPMTYYGSSLILTRPVIKVEKCFSQDLMWWRQAAQSLLFKRDCRENGGENVVQSSDNMSHTYFRKVQTLRSPHMSPIKHVENIRRAFLEIWQPVRRGFSKPFGNVLLGMSKQAQFSFNHKYY